MNHRTPETARVGDFAAAMIRGRFFEGKIIATHDNFVTLQINPKMKVDARRAELFNIAEGN